MVRLYWMSKEDKKSRFKRIAKETLDAVELGHYTAPSGKVYHIPREASFLIEPDWEKGEPRPKENRSPKITLTQESTMEAAQRLASQGACILNFASGTNPGGGFINGAVAQEECLARSSNLYASLIEHPEFYKENKNRPGIYKNYAIYSPDTMFIKNDKGDWLDEPYKVATVTSAAPNMNYIRQLTGQTLNPDVEEEFYDRINQVLNLMADMGHRTIVLGAWGCGAFGNDPWLVSDFFLDLLEANPYFDEVVFAIFDKKESDTFKAFNHAFGAKDD